MWHLLRRLRLGRCCSSGGPTIPAPTGSPIPASTPTTETDAHELGKFCKLVLGANPTAIERPCLGDELLSMRKDFLSASGVRNSYLGYARSQAQQVTREACLDFGRRVAAGQNRLVYEMLAWADEQFETSTPLPKDNEAGWAKTDEWLRRVRTDDPFAKRG